MSLNLFPFFSRLPLVPFLRRSAMRAVHQLTAQFRSYGSSDAKHTENAHKQLHLCISSRLFIEFSRRVLSIAPMDADGCRLQQSERWIEVPKPTRPVDGCERGEKVSKNGATQWRGELGKWCAERKVLVTGDRRGGGGEAAKLSTLEMNIRRVFPFGMINCDNNAFISAKILKWIVLHNKICGKRKHCCRASASVKRSATECHRRSM